MHEAAFVRVARFRTTRPAFDAALRGSLLPAIRRHPGVVGVFAGRQGPEEVGTRLLVSLWSSEEAMVGAPGLEGPEVAVDGPLAETVEWELKILPVLFAHLARPALSSGILRLSDGRLAELDLASYAAMLSEHLAALRADAAGPVDSVMAGEGDRFVMLSTWPRWSDIEAATGASISEPLRTKRLAALRAFEVGHYELLTSLPETD